MRSGLAVLMGFVTFFSVSAMVTAILVAVMLLLAKLFSSGSAGVALIVIFAGATLGMLVAVGVSGFVAAWFAKRAPYTHATIVVAMVWLVLRWRGSAGHHKGLFNLWGSDFPPSVIVLGMVALAAGTWLGSRTQESS
jgi:hypothetical protein